MSATDYDPFIAPRVGQLQEAAAQTRHGGSEGQAADFSFGDLLDVINPLQHLPIIGNIYRELTGDEISGTARIVGGGLYGGPFGLVNAAFNQIFEDATGRDMAETALAAATGQDLGDPAADVAQGAPPAQQAAAQAATSGAVSGPTAAPTTSAAATAAAASEPDEAAAADVDLLTGQAALSALAADLRATARPSGEAATAQQLSSQPGVPPSSFMPVAARDFAGPRPQTSPVSRPADPPETPQGGTAATEVDAETASLGREAPPAATAPAPTPAVPAVANPLLMPAPTSDADFTERMMEALMKYEALTKEQVEAVGRPAVRG